MASLDGAREIAWLRVARALLMRRAMDDQVDLTVRRSPSGVLWTGAIAALTPFVISSASSSTVTVNGKVVESTYRDWFAIFGGGVALACALAAIWFVHREGRTPKVLGAIAAVAAVGGYQVARGFGAI